LLASNLNIAYSDPSFNDLVSESLINLDIDNTNFDFDFTMPLNQDDILLRNNPSISTFEKNIKIPLIGGQIWSSYTYIINSTLHDNVSPNILEYDISFNIFNLDSYIFYLSFEPKSPTLSILNNTTIKMSLPDNAISDLFNNIMNYSDGLIYFDAIDEITINYYLWSHTDISNNLPNNYNGDINRLKQNPNSYTNENGFLDIDDISFSYLLDSINTISIKKTYNSNFNDITQYDDFVLFENINLEFTSNYLSTFPIPYIGRWSVELKLKNGNIHYSDISGTLDISESSVPVLYRINNLKYETNNNDKIITNIFNKYNYGILLNPDNSLPPPPPTIYVDPCENFYNCSKVPVITKTKDTLTQVQRYSNAVKYKIYSKKK